MRLIPLLLALLAGTIIPVEAGVNSRMGKQLGGPIFAALLAYAVGTLTLVVITLASGRTLPAASRMAGAPWWAWVGGILGATFVLLSIQSAPKVGSVVFVAAIIAGQMLASVALDHFALVGYARHPISVGRVCGLALIAGGVALVHRF